MQAQFPLLLAAVSLVSCQQERTELAPKPAAAPVKILHFYASPSHIEPGSAVTVCYGVENARSVRLDPPVESLAPVFHRCFQVAPSRTTTYTLMAEGGDGTTARASFTIHVVSARAAAELATPTEAESPREMIQLFAASAAEIPPGQPVTLCYGVHGAASVQVEPYGLPLKPAERFCFSVRPAVTTTYVLTATASDGRQEQAQLTVRVR
ncbi:MAG: hypothetical protein RMK57_03670 [Bryobacterales bacterium]|nr:hypothetical protein [Bryobacteraceae bacterium]MDW8353607.1 hypothetical protein [Bryobacterales bacterium]